jgi:two-component system NtrC family sensor kinase
VRHADVLFLYVALTGGAILVLMYVALTVLIVRPVDVLTRASERMARGNLDVIVPEKGAAEVAALAASFNSMSAQLKADKRALETKVRELTETTADLTSAQGNLVRSEQLASVGRLSAGLAHEIGNPLAAVLGLIELLRGGDLSAEETAEFLMRIESETQRIHHIIRDLLDFARQGKDEEDAGATADLRRAVEDAIALLAPGKNLRGATLERALTDVPRVRGSEARMKQLVLNLLLNAADAVAGNGAVRVSLAAEGEFVVLVVEDDGPGIAPEIREHLFEPFATTKPAGQGTGLGLAVCHTIVQRSGGSISAAAQTSKGARFVVRLPLA